MRRKATTEAQRHREGRGSLERESLDAVPEHWDIEVQQQTDSHIAQPQVSEDLRFVHRSEALYRLDLDDNPIFHNDVQSITTVELHRFVEDR
jgi:hypothetical protein